MRYFFTTANRNFACGILALFLCTSLQAQKNTDSPYSRYGIGLMHPSNFNGNFAMGGTGIAWRSFQYKPLINDSLARSNAKLNDRGTNYINPTNPASFSNISLTTFEAALINRNVDYTSGSQSRTGVNTQLNHVSVGLPIGKKWGVVFGIRPFSSVGYDYSINDNINGNDVTYSYDGSGGVNELFVGTGVELSNSLSIGFKGIYYFGNIFDDRRVVYGDNSTNFFNTLDERETKVSSSTFQLGLQYYKELKNDYRIIGGAVISTISKLNGSRSQLIRNYTGAVDVENFRDTALVVDEEDIDVAFAPTYGIGLAIEKKYKWILALDAQTMLWDNERINDQIEFANSQLMSMGYEKYSQPNALGSYFKKLGYRAGVRYNSSLVRIENEDIKEFGISFGITMPLKRSFSTINFGVEVGRRGKDENGLSQEDFLNIQFGVNINDKWFIKRKYD